MNRLFSLLNPAHLLMHSADKPFFRYRNAMSWGLSFIVGGTVIGGALVSEVRRVNAEEAIPTGQPMTLLADVQEANAITGVVTARGNVQIFYPARNMQATAVQAQYYSREGRIVLNGDVYILQDGNSIQGEVVTYLIDEGRFVALPNDGDQVQSVYLVADDEPAAGTVGPPVEAFNPKPEFKTPISP
ncbi:MAG: LptA/OstA family protein [Cyanobacteria bacterium P01_F01_bin.150]